MSAAARPALRPADLPGPRWSGLAQGVHAMVNAASPSNGDARKLWLPIGWSFALLLTGAAGLIVVTVWLTTLSARANATVPISTQLSELKSTVDGINGKMELVLGVRDDVIEMKSQVKNLERRQTELWSILDTNRAYVSKLTSVMERQGIPVPPPPAWQGEPRKE